MRLSRLAVAALASACLIGSAPLALAQTPPTTAPAGQPAQPEQPPAAGPAAQPGNPPQPGQPGAPGTAPTAAPATPGQTGAAAATPAQTGPPPPSAQDMEQAFRLHTEGGQLLTKKQYKKAVLRLGEALKLNPNLPDAWFDLGLAYTYAGEFKFAEYCIEKVKKMGGDTRFLLSELAKTKPAEPPKPKELAPSKGLQPGNVFGITVPKTPPTPAQQSLAVQYQTAGGRMLEARQFDQAVVQYKQALSLNPGLKDCWSDLALALIYGGKYDLAQSAIDELKKLGDDGAWPTSELVKARGNKPPDTSQTGMPAPPK